MTDFDKIFYRFLLSREQFRVVMFSLFAFCILVLSVVFFVLSIVKPYMGTTLYMSNQGWVVNGVDPNGLAIQAGIKVGDMPIKINGQPAETFLEKYKKSRLVNSILIRELTVIDEHGQSRSVTLEGSSQSWKAAATLGAYFFACLIFWITGFYVFFKQPGNIAALLLALCGLCFGLALSATYAGERLVPTAFWFAVVATAIGPWLLLHFFLVLPEERTWLRSNPLVYLIYLPTAIILILFPLIGYADGQPLPGFRTFRMLVISIGFLATSGMVIFNYFHAELIRTRQQMKIVLIGCLAALIPLWVTYVLPTAMWRQPVIPGAISVLFIAFIPIVMGYAIVTQKLMDIDVIVRRGIIYGLVSLVMAAVLSAAIFPVLAFRRLVGVPEAILIALVLGGTATVLFGPTKRTTENLVDRLFYKDRYDYRQIIQSVSTALNLVKGTSEASRLIVGTIVHTLNLTGSGLFIKAQSDSFELGAAQGIYTDASKQAELLALMSKRNRMMEFPNSASSVSSGLAFLIPLIAGEKEVGILCVSRKVSRQDFSSDDLFLLQGLASITAMALHSAMLIRDVSLRDTFVSVASHELRTPLTSILGYADLLLRRNPPDATRKRWLKKILDNSQRISAMVDDLLNVSRIQSGKTSVKLDRIRLSDILEETLSLIKESSKEHEFVIEIEPDLPDVLVDRDKFSQLVGNLLSNAVKYSPGGGRVMLSAHNDKERHQIVVSVSDEGIGIGPEDKDLLFATFHRIQRPETQGIKGSGLGLYIAKKWTEAMGGNIWLESELNKGSTFFVGIPTKDSNGTA